VAAPQIAEDLGRHARLGPRAGVGGGDDAGVAVARFLGDAGTAVDHGDLEAPLAQLERGGDAMMPAPMTSTCICLLPCSRLQLHLARQIGDQRRTNQISSTATTIIKK